MRNSVFSILLNIWIMCNKGLCRPSMGRPLDRCVDRQSADMSTEYQPILGRHVDRVNRPSVDTIGRYVGRHSTDTSADMLRLTVGCASVDCRWHQSIVRCFFAEIAAISFPTGDAKEDSIAYVRVLIERRCSPNCRHFENISNATLRSRWPLSREKKDSREHIPGYPIDGKELSIDRCQLLKLVN